MQADSRHNAVAAAVPFAGALALEPMGGFEAVEQEWRELATRSDNLFASWEWASTWWRHFGDGQPLHLTSCRSPDGRLIAVLPLYIWHGPLVRVLRFVGHGPADELGPVCEKQHVELVSRALRDAFAQRRWRCDLFLGDVLPGDEDWAAMLEARTLGREASPLRRLDGETWEQYQAAMSRKTRGNENRKEKRLQRDFELRFRLADDPERLQDDISTLLRLHADRWGAESSAFDDGRADFHRDFAALALERDWLRLWLLELDGKPAAAWYGFRYNGVELFYQGGRDPHFERSNVGSVLMRHALREAMADGAREFRLLRGDESYKRRLANADHGLDTVAVACSLKGSASISAASLLRRSAPVRNWLVNRAQPG